MAIKIKITDTSRENTITVGAGEPIPFSYSMVATGNGAPISLTGRAFVWALYSGDRQEEKYFEATLTTDDRGDIAFFDLPGTVSEELYSKSPLKWDLSERLKDGRDTISSGALIITETAPRVDALSSAPRARVVARITRVDDPTIATGPAITVTYAPYEVAPVVVPEPTPAPAWTVQPTISGTAGVGQTISTQDGTVTNGTVTARAWLRDGAVISGATGSTYVTVNADAGMAISVRLTATGPGGTANATSGTISIPAPVTAPTNTVAPVASGTGTLGQTLSVTPGTWTGSPTYSYQWLRGASPISGETSATYTLVAADQGTSVSCRVTATNAGGSTSATSNAISVAAAVSAPTNSAAPVVSGTGTTGQTLTVSNGTWTGSPTYSYQWLRGAVAISGATNSSYLLVSADETSAVSCRVTATNAGGSASATSNTITVTGPKATADSINWTADTTMMTVDQAA